MNNITESGIQQDSLQSGLIKEFMTVFDGILDASPVAKEQELIGIFEQLDDYSKDKLYSRKDALGNSLLNNAASTNKESLAITLVNLGFDVDNYNCNGKSVLINAISNEYYLLIDALIEKGVDINYAKLSKGHTGHKIGASALQVAAQAGNFEIVKKLVENGADINYKNDLGQFALLYTIKNTESHLKCFEYLIQQPNIVVDTYDKLGNHVLDRIVRFGSTAFLAVALEHGAYNESVYNISKDQVERGVGNGGNVRDKNTPEQSLEILSWIPKILSAQKLKEELPTKSEVATKRIKL